MNIFGNYKSENPLVVTKSMLQIILSTVYILDRKGSPKGRRKISAISREFYQFMAWVL